MTLRWTDSVADRALSDQRIESAPAEVRALFHEFQENWVYDALSMAGINGPPEDYTPEQIAEGVEIARKLLETQRRRDQEALLASFKR
ncbi:hypothetical protein GURKE_02660 [Brevundimonas phage vB_BpoS-Gurke]|uniref:Uncharacterized protein n=1 Tax=Brevundimonas phage vB_BpoS-Gurke TaxID=2948599 RepID=A0A9E7STF7_9CAUD|nr:hypothetical protein GURKE_02660 [Brevundimonas phage vB_BpoS-Gurke]